MNKSQHTSITNGIGGHVPKRAMESLAVVCLRMDVIMQSNYLSLSLSYRSSILLTLHCFASELLLAITVTNAIPLNRFEFHSSTEVRRHFHLPTTLHPNEWNAIILFSVDSFSFFSVRFMPLCAIREKFSRLCAAPTRLYWSFPNGKLSLSLSYLSNDDWFKMTHNTLLTISSLSVWFCYPRQLTMFSYGLYRFLSIIQRNAQIDSFFSGGGHICIHLPKIVCQIPLFFHSNPSFQPVFLPFVLFLFHLQFSFTFFKMLPSCLNKCFYLIYRTYIINDSHSGAATPSWVSVCVCVCFFPANDEHNREKVV